MSDAVSPWECDSESCAGLRVSTRRPWPAGSGSRSRGSPRSKLGLHTLTAALLERIADALDLTAYTRAEILDQVAELSD
ncbi:MAG: hypothetical protein JWM18_1246 [Chloroflexi bacterium]|nr:hypothetical protein [Chloroflexota bacterium]